MEIREHNIKRVDSNVVEMHNTEEQKKVTINGETIIESNNGEALNEAFYDIAEALEKEDYTLKEWVKDRERTNDYPDNDKSNSRFVLFRQYSDGRTDILETSDNREKMVDYVKDKP